VKNISVTAPATSRANSADAFADHHRAPDQQHVEDDENHAADQLNPAEHGENESAWPWQEVRRVCARASRHEPARPSASTPATR
jgi:hypothetical protein